jgi:anaerobic ribonucleoside-triphosphate reductase activating protein
MKIAISRVHFPVTTLGPGRRLGIWLQGCSIRCAGCISADTWAFGSGAIEVSMLVNDLEPWLAECEGITVSGGEPFDQCDALVDLLRAIKGAVNTDVLIFSGYSLEKLQPSLVQLAGLVDALVSDPFDQTASRTLSLRGSDNQRLTLLSSRGKERFAHYNSAAPAERHLDIMFGDEGVTWMAGIPKNDDFVRMEAILVNGGNKILTSRSRSSPR